MPKHVNMLNATRVRQEKRLGRHHDGNGLYLEVDDHGRRWALRLTIKGRRTWVGLGPVDLKSLADAREDRLQSGRLEVLRLVDHHELPLQRSSAQERH